MTQNDSESIEDKFMRYLDRVGSYADGLTDGVANSSSKALPREEAVWRVKELRNLRREFMAACGECDDAYMVPGEEKLFQFMEDFLKKVMDAYDITPEEIDAAELPFTAADGRRTAMPQFPSKFDM